MSVARLNALPAEEAVRALLQCCGSRAWAERMASARPFASREALFASAGQVWWALAAEDWLEAFRAHPRIGESRAEAGQTAREQGWSAREQSGMAAAAEETRSELARLNREYEARFGHIYIVCATGRSADELLGLLRERIAQDPDQELRTAAAEQARITRIRLEKLIDDPQPSVP